MKEKEKKKNTGKISVPELLVPAGGKEQLRAAVANGADAVYLSGTSFNARINADNFSDSDLQEAVAFAHEHGVRVHIALNTLLRSCETEEAVSFARSCRSWGADALILQDRGLAARLREELPDIALHLSTQGTVYDSRGVREAVQAGFQRVILARELSLSEIAGICAQTDAEIEIFAHGAICISYSGQCHLSYVIGGRSGNRGTCAQPCRLPYTLMRRKNGSFDEIGGQSGKYLLSPADLCLLGHLQEIAETGVSSLKIEGRMKSPEYVAVVTGIYRRHLDLLAEGGPSRVTEKEYEQLCTVFNRGGMTDSYFYGDSGAALMSCDLPKHRGIPLGTVISCDPRKRHIVVRLSGDLSVGDGVEIRDGEKRYGNIVTYLNDRGNMQKKAQKGQTVTIGDIDGRIRPGSRIFKISDRELKKNAEQSWQKIQGRIPVDITVRIQEGEPVLLRAAAPLWRAEKNGISAVAEVRSDSAAERAVKKVLRKTDVIRQAEKTGGTPYYLNQCSVSITGSPMVPASVLNTLRRKALENLTRQRLQRMKDTETREKENEFAASYRLQECQIPPKPEDPAAKATERKEAREKEDQADRRISLYFFDTDENEKKAVMFLRTAAEEQRKKIKSEGKREEAEAELDIIIPLHRFLADPSLFLEEAKKLSPAAHIVPYLPAITKNLKSEKLERDAALLEELGRSGRIKAVMLAHAGQKSLFQEKNILCFGDESLNLSNDLSVFASLSGGLSRVMLSNELPDGDLEEIAVSVSGRSPEGAAALEILAYGRIPVMYTEHCAVGMRDDETACKSLSDSGKDGRHYYCRQGNYFLRDRKGADFPLICDCSTCRMEILSHRSFDRRTLFQRLQRNPALKRLPSARIYIYDETPEQIIRIVESLTEMQNCEFE